MGEITDEVLANLLSADHLFAKQSDFKDNLPARREAAPDPEIPSPLAVPTIYAACSFRWFHSEEGDRAKWPWSSWFARSRCVASSAEITAVFRCLTSLKISPRRGVANCSRCAGRGRSGAAGRTYATVLICFQEKRRPSWSKL